MKKIFFLPLTICILLAIIWMAEPAVGRYKAPAQANSALDTDKNKSAEQHFEKAIELLRQEIYQEAIVEYEKVIKLVPESKIAQDAQYWIGQSYFRMGQFDEALLIFKKLIEDYPGSAVVPVTQLMMARAQQAKENKKLKAKRDLGLDKKVIINPKTGVKFSKIGALSGKKDVVAYSKLYISPNGKFLLHDYIVIPLKGEEPFDLVDTEAWRGIWSPDGEKVAFYSGEAICVVPVSPETGRPTGPAKKLLEGKYRFQAPVSWSPDSEKIVFAKRDEKNQGDIWTLSLKDGTLNQITDDPEVELNPSWSPDGKKIAYNRGNFEIRVISANGGKSRKIIDIDYGRYISWSPDGKWLFIKGFTEGRKLNLIRLADEHVFDIDPPDEVGDFFAWSSDGKKMLFYYPSYDYTNVLKVVSASGGPSFQLGRELKLWPYDQFWSLDSKMIITPGEDSTFWIPLAGGDAFPLKIDVPVKGKLHLLSLSPDRERLLFSVEQGAGNENLYVIPISLKDAQTTGPPILVFSEWEGWRGLNNWSWSPNGNKLAIIHKDDIWITFAKKDKAVQITKTPFKEILPVWSPVGEMIVYIAEIEDGKEILKMIPATGGKTTTILDNCAKWSYVWTPDGKEIIAESKGIILAIPIDGGKARKILDLKEQGLIDSARGLSWLPDGKHLAFISQKGRKGPTRIFVIPAKGGKVTELATDDDDWKDWLYPSPNGKWISYNSEGYVKTRPEGSIWEAAVDELLMGGKREQKR